MLQKKKVSLPTLSIFFLTCYPKHIYFFYLASSALSFVLMKTYIMSTHKNCLTEMLLMSTHIYSGTSMAQTTLGP